MDLWQFLFISTLVPLLSSEKLFCLHLSCKHSDTPSHSVVRGQSSLCGVYIVRKILAFTFGPS